MWTKLLSNDNGAAAHGWAAMNNNLRYHNKHHILQMYRFLERHKVPYYRELDWAILFHDAVYDRNGNNEWRSAEFFMSIDGTYLTDEERVNVHDLIVVTEDHVAPVDDRLAHWLVLADLESFSNMGKWWNTRSLVEEEMCLMHGISSIEFLEKNTKFLINLAERLDRNVLLPLGRDNYFTLEDRQIVMYDTIVKNIRKIVTFQSNIISDSKV